MERNYRRQTPWIFGTLFNRDVRDIISPPPPPPPSIESGFYTVINGVESKMKFINHLIPILGNANQMPYRWFTKNGDGTITWLNTANATKIDNGDSDDIIFPNTGNSSGFMLLPRDGAWKWQGQTSETAENTAAIESNIIYINRYLKIRLGVSSYGGVPPLNAQSGTIVTRIELNQANSMGDSVYEIANANRNINIWKDYVNVGSSWIDVREGFVLSYTPPGFTGTIEFGTHIFSTNCEYNFHVQGEAAATRMLVKAAGGNQLVYTGVSPNFQTGSKTFIGYVDEPGGDFVMMWGRSTLKYYFFFDPIFSIDIPSTPINQISLRHKRLFSKDGDNIYGCKVIDVVSGTPIPSKNLPMFNMQAYPEGRPEVLKIGSYSMGIIPELTSPTFNAAVTSNAIQDKNIIPTPVWYSPVTILVRGPETFLNTHNIGEYLITATTSNGGNVTIKKGTQSAITYPNSMFLGEHGLYTLSYSGTQATISKRDIDGVVETSINITIKAPNETLGEIILFGYMGLEDKIIAGNGSGNIKLISLDLQNITPITRSEFTGGITLHRILTPPIMQTAGTRFSGAFVASNGVTQGIHGRSGDGLVPLNGTSNTLLPSEMDLTTARIALVPK